MSLWTLCGWEVGLCHEATCTTAIFHHLACENHQTQLITWSNHLKQIHFLHPNNGLFFKADSPLGSAWLAPQDGRQLFKLVISVEMALVSLPSSQIEAGVPELRWQNQLHAVQEIQKRYKCPDWNHNLQRWLFSPQWDVISIILYWNRSAVHAGKFLVFVFNCTHHHNKCKNTFITSKRKPLTS